MRGLLAAKRGHPLALRNARLVDADLVGEGGLKRALPLSWNARTPFLVPQPAFPIQRKSEAKNASMPSMV